LYCRKYRNNL
jgi:hypothetical protein